MATGAQQAQPDFWGDLERRIRAEWLAVTVFSLLVTALLCWQAGPLGIQRIDNTFYDRLVTHTLQADASEDIVIIAIDDRSIELLGYWPWRRATHAALLQRLDQARVVGLDILMSDRNTAYPRDDMLLARAIAGHGRVVLPTTLSDRHSTVIPPYGALAEAAAAVGFVNIYPDEDGIVRSLPLKRTLQDGSTRQHFLLAMAMVAGQPVQHAGLTTKDQPLLVPFRGPPGHYTVYPYASVLRGDIPATAFKDKFVIVGAWATGLGDVFPTPVDSAGETMPGIEILANTLQSGIEDNWIRTPPLWLLIVLSCCPVLLACLTFRFLSPRRAFGVTLGLVLLLFAGSAALLVLLKVWVPIVAALIGVAISLPLWSWRSQEASLQHISRELLALHQERISRGEEVPGAGKWTRSGGSLSSHVSQLHDAIAQLRLHYRQREDTVRFLSHDMRSPQNSILALIKLQQQPHSALGQSELLERIGRYASDTLQLVDGFVHLSRAEAASLKLDSIDLVSLTEETTDEFWASARQRGITVTTADMPAQAWIIGDSNLLRRVWANLVDNAIKYSPDNTTISCAIDREDGFWRARFIDQGPGIPPEHLDKLFKPFTRITQNGPVTPPGTGLGLAFVQTVIVRHGGSICAVNREGGGAEFVVRLPVSD